MILRKNAFLNAFTILGRFAKTSQVTRKIVGGGIDPATPR
jgi:hypothetical protein